jgi:plasmid stabilization system protein ParE
MTTILFHPDADSEFTEELEYYSETRDGVVGRFRESIEQAVARAAANPRGGKPSFGQTRAMRVKGFPFDVIYLESFDELFVVAIAGHRRSPGYWLPRLP